MQLLNGFQATPQDSRDAVIAIGNFDGLHRGHQAVLELAVKKSHARNVPAGLLTFEPHPRTFFAPHNPVFQITTPILKQRIAAALGLDFMATVAFDEQLAGRTPEEFAKDVLHDGFNATHVITGSDFRFGRARAGDLDVLKQLGVQYGFEVTGVSPVGQEGEDAQDFSSTSVRHALLHGNPRAAAEVLGYWWMVMGEVVSGDQRGREIGFPTANIKMSENAAPRLGIYAVRINAADGDRETWSGAGYVGRRPTFDKEEIVLEVHLFDYKGDLYGRTLMIEFIEFIRGDEKFTGIEDLVARMTIDCETARGMLADIAGSADPMRQFPIGAMQAENSV